MFPQAASSSAAAAMMTFRDMPSRLAAPAAPFQPPCRARRGDLSPGLMKSATALVLLLLLAGCERQSSAPPPDAPSAPAKGLDRSQAGKPLPDIEIRDPEDEPATLAEATGGPLLVNIWATWCAPCVKELPTLDRLAGAHAGDGKLGVVTISQDMAPQGSVTAFLEDLKTEHLGAYHDDKMALSGALGVQVMPTTILYGSDGREIWRYVGDLDWTGAEAQTLLSEAK